MENIIKFRRIVQGLVAAILYFTISYFKINLLYIVILGAIVGIIFGKVFCRWICPMGFIMEILMSKNIDSNKQQMYQYHKLGCPIAWIEGLLNKYSLFRIKRDESSCTSCGKCDRVCYITSLNKDFSLFKKKKLNPTTNFSCSKCLKCVDSCPENSLSYKI